jgi:hypothetical protein
MTAFTLFYGILLGFFLAVGDGSATQVRMQYGYKKGLLTWLAMTAAPLAIAIYVDYKVALVAAIAGFVLSGLVFWQARTGRASPFSTAD